MQKHDLVKLYNFFGHAVYSPMAALMDNNGPLREFLVKQLKDTLGDFGYDFPGLASLGQGLIDSNERELAENRRIGFKRQFLLHKIEDTLRDVLRKDLFEEPNHSGRPGASIHRSIKLKDRSRRIAQQVASVLERAKIFDDKLLNSERLALLDVGCGDGMVTAELIEILETNKNWGNMRIDPIVLLDVVDYRTRDVKNQKYLFVELPPDYQQFVLAERTSKASLKGQRFDLILILTVLHHSQVPSSVFRACAEVANDGAVIVVIESCVGIVRSNGSKLGLNKEAQDYNSTARSEFGSLGIDDQLRYASFVDWFYNRVIQTCENVYVPCNFGTPEEWNSLFREFAGFDVLATYYEGFDQPLVPEFHTVHVVKRL